MQRSEIPFHSRLVVLVTLLRLDFTIWMVEFHLNDEEIPYMTPQRVKFHSYTFKKFKSIVLEMQQV